MENITPDTYKKMNEEFIREDIAFRITIPTQEEIDHWRSQPSQSYQPPPARDLVAEMWEEHNRKVAQCQKDSSSALENMDA